MCGGSVGSVVKKATGAVKSVTAGAINIGTVGLVKKSDANSFVDKASSVAVGTAAGFVGGGGIGAVAGFGRGIYQNTRTSKAEEINLRRVGQGAATGAAANIAAGIVGSGVAHAGGLSGALTKATAFGKSGGLAGNIGSIVKGVGNFALKAAPVLTGLVKKGAGAVSPDNVDSAVADGQNIVGRVQNGLRQARAKIDSNPTLKNAAESLADKTGLDRYIPYLNGNNNNGATPIIVPSGSGGDSAPTNPLLYAALGLGMFLILKKR